MPSGLRPQGNPLKVLDIVQSSIGKLVAPIRPSAHGLLDKSNKLRSYYLKIPNRALDLSLRDSSLTLHDFWVNYKNFEF